MMTMEAYAKLNLSLRVIRRRSDGYHEIDSLVQTIDLADRLSVTQGDQGLRVVNDLRIPHESDLTYQAAAAVFERKKETPNLTIRVMKGIPVGAGLGGGSSDAAAALRIADQINPPSLGDDELCRLGAGIGADVCLFLKGGSIRMEGVGERIRPAQSDGIGAYVVLVPPFGCDTGTVYRAWAKHRSGGPWRNELEFGRNDLLEPALACYPKLHPYYDAALQAGGEYAGMSGSGATFFVACQRREAAEPIREQFELRFPKATVRIAVPMPCGHQVIETEGDT